MKMPAGLQRYHVTVEREGTTRAVAKTRQHTLVLNAEKGRGETGFNAAETLMASLGACFMTNLNSLAAKMRLAIEDITLDIDGVRLDDPPGISQLTYVLTLVSKEPIEKLNQLYDLSVKWGTVTNTLIRGVQISGTLHVEKPAE